MASRIHSLHRRGGGRRWSATGEPIDPLLAGALRDRLTESGNPRLASTGGQLRVVEQCRCGDPGCTSFYTVPAHQVRHVWGKRGKTIGLGPGLAVDVVDDVIVAVEILDDRGA